MIRAALQQAGLGVALLALAVIVDGVHVSDSDIVHLLDGGLDLKLVRLAVDDETVTVQLFALSRSVTIGLIKIPISFSPLLYSCCEDILNAVDEHEGVSVHDSVGVDLVNGDHLHVRKVAG